MTTLRIGLTGPIGCGKSTVGGWLAEAGALLVDADAVARGVTAPGTRGHDAVLRAFGRQVRAADGSLDRAKLAAIVFSDPDRLRELEALVHPLVRPLILARIDDAERAAAPAVVIEAIRLVESGLAALCDEVWLVACTPDEQRRRLEGRGMDPHDTERRMAAQGDLADRLRAVATRVIDTSGSPDETRDRVTAALDEALITPGS